MNHLLPCLKTDVSFHFFKANTFCLKFLLVIDPFLWHHRGQDFQYPWITGSTGELISMYILAAAKLQKEWEERASWLGTSKSGGGLSSALESGGNVLPTLFPLIGQCELWGRWNLKRKTFYCFKVRKETTLLFQSKMLDLPGLGMVEADRWVRDSRCQLGVAQVTRQSLPPGLGKRRDQGVDSLGDSEGPKAWEGGEEIRRHEPCNCAIRLQ